MPNPIYDPLASEKEFKELESKCGKDAVKQAQRYANSVFEANDLNAVTRLIELEKEFGKETVEKAVAKVSEKFTGNPKRNISYLIGTIESMGQGNSG